MNEATAIDERAQLIDGLRQLADFLDAHPDITPCTQTYNVYVSDREELARIARLGSWEKVYHGAYFSLRKSFSGGVVLDVFTDRDLVCRKVVVGQRVIAAQPAIEERIEDVEEWICDETSLLSGRPADVAP